MKFRYSASTVDAAMHSLGFTAWDHYVCKNLLPAYVPMRVWLTADLNIMLHILLIEGKLQRANKKLPRPSLCGSLMDPEDPSGEDRWTDSKFMELCFHRFSDDDEQQGPALPTSVALLDRNLVSMVFAADLLLQIV